MPKDDVVYDLIRHVPLADLLAFVIARDDVREMCAPPSVAEPSPDSYADTIPLPASTTAPPRAQ